MSSYTIKLTLNSDAKWTKALKLMLADLKVMPMPIAYTAVKSLFAFLADVGPPWVLPACRACWLQVTLQWKVKHKLGSASHSSPPPPHTGGAAMDGQAQARQCAATAVAGPGA